MNGKWLAERIFNGPFCKQDAKEMALYRVTPDYLCSQNDSQQQLLLPRQQQHNQLQQTTPDPFKFAAADGCLTLKQFLHKYSLPRLVNIVPEEPILTIESSDPATLLNGTLLLYKRYRSGKIEAKKFPNSRSVKLTIAGDGPKEVVSTIVIPDTYQGWFSVMTERGQVKARQYTIVQRLIAAQVTAFLIIGPDLIGYYQNTQKITDGARSRHQYIKTVVRSGQILKLLAVYEDIVEQSTRSKRLSWPLLGSKQQSTQYAQCVTSKKQIVYIPITTHGYFYAVSTANNTAEDNVSKVYQISKLLQVFPLPVRVSNIYPQKINGSMLLENYHKEDVMLAYVLDEKTLLSSSKSRFLEIDINSKFYVNLVPDEHRLFKKARVQKALRACQTDSDEWCQQLKIIHHIYPNKNQGESSSQSADKLVKRTRKLSIGDKKTVKSASFRYSTSYGPEDGAPVKPEFIRHSAPTEAYYSKSTSHVPPVYLNIAYKPNEENCSSLPTQKADRTQFKNEMLQYALHSELQNKEKHEETPKQRHFQCKNSSELSYDKAHMVTNNESKRLNIYKNNDKLPLRPPKLSDLRYRVIKKENTCIERDFSKISRYPVYKTQVVVKIDNCYSDVVDALRTPNSSGDNIYTEINDYTNDLVTNNKFTPLFPLKTSCFVSDNCSRSYIRVPSTSTVNVS